MGRRLCFGFVALIVSLFILRGTILAANGKYEATRDGKTLVWNDDPKPGDVATWSGDRDRNDYARGFGELQWYTHQPGTDRPQLFARYWGRMVDGKFEGPVNVHSRKQTSYAIFIEGARATKWTRGTAPLGANDFWRTLVAQRSQRRSREPEPVREVAERRRAREQEREPVEPQRERAEPEAPAAGPAFADEQLRRSKPIELSSRPNDDRSGRAGSREEISAGGDQSIPDLAGDNWPKIDVDDSLRRLVFPPRRLRR